jgi:hypothetical protein
MVLSDSIVVLYTSVLFFLLTPNVIVRLPPKANNLTVAFVHTLIFAFLFYFIHRFVLLDKIAIA